MFVLVVHLAVMMQSALIIEAKSHKIFHNDITLLTFHAEFCISKKFSMFSVDGFGPDGFRAKIHETESIWKVVSFFSTLWIYFQNPFEARSDMAWNFRYYLSGIHAIERIK